MNILTLDSSGETSFAGIVNINGKNLKCLNFINNLNKKSKPADICSLLNNVLKKNNDKVSGKIDLIASIMGPGSFSGIRASSSASFGLSKALKVPKIGINTMDKLYTLSLKNKLINNELKIGILTICDSKRNYFFVRLSDSKEHQNKVEDIKTVSIENLLEVKNIFNYKKILIAGSSSEEVSIHLKKNGIYSESILEKETIYGKEGALAIAEVALIQRKIKSKKEFKPLYLTDPIVNYG